MSNDPMGIADLLAKLNSVEVASGMARTTDEWVTPAAAFTSCERCEGTENVFALQTIFYQPVYLCRACITQAAVLANRETLALGEVT